MPIEDVFSISGRGTVATGRVERGVATKGSEVEILGFGSKLKTVLTGIGALAPSSYTALSDLPTEMFHKELERAEAGDNMGALLRGIKREQIRRGQVLAAPGSVKSAKKFLAQIYVSLLLHESEGQLANCLALGFDQGGRWSLHSFHGQLHASALPPYC